MYCTGDPDRAPIRCTEPTGYAHSGPEAAFAAMTALASGLPQRVDLSMQEVVLVANMAAPARFPETGARGSRRGANIGRTREIWPTLDGFVSFGLRGGKARVPSLEILTKLVAGDGVPADALVNRDWNDFNQNTATDEDLAAIETAVAEYFSRHTMQELYDIAVETNLMLAPANSPREIYQSAQLAARDFFGPVGDVERFPQSFVITRSPGDEVAPVASGRRRARRRSRRVHRIRVGEPPAARRAGAAWEGLKIIEFGSGAAGPIATRYFVEHGATVLRVESKTRPDFLRAYSMAPDNPNGLEFSTMYDGLNVGKKNVALNLKKPEAVALVKRLVTEWADAVAENYAPKAMKGFGLDYDALAAIKPDLVMISACLNGQTGPHKDYPGFGGQGAALGGYNALTGWPDREPVGPYGTITDSLAPRYVAAALAAGLLYRRRYRQGRVPRHLAGRVGELVAVAVAARLRGRRPHPPPRRQPARARVPARRVPLRRRRRRRRPLGRDRVLVRRSSGPTLASILGVAGDPRFATLASRKEHEDDIEALLTAFTATRTRADVAEPAAGGRHRSGPGRRLRRPPRRPAARAARPLRAAHAPVPRRGALRAQRFPPVGRARAATTRRARPSARTATGCSATSSVAPTARSTR